VAGLDPGALLIHRGIWGLLMQHFLNFLPEPQGHGSLRPIFTLVGSGELSESSSKSSKAKGGIFSP